MLTSWIRLLVAGLHVSWKMRRLMRNGLEMLWTKSTYFASPDEKIHRSLDLSAAIDPAFDIAK
jgi:hypothetical protein